MEQTGLDGRIDVREGGHGQPYEVEWPGQSQRIERSSNASASQIEHCQEMINHASSDAEKNQWRQQLAEAMGLIAVIWIKVNSQEEFEAKRQLVVHTHQLAVQVARQSAGKK